MCLAIPGKVVKKEGEFVEVDYNGEIRKAKLLEDNVEVGDYVMVNAGFVMQKIPEEEAIASLKVWENVA